MISELLLYKIWDYQEWQVALSKVTVAECSNNGRATSATAIFSIIHEKERSKESVLRLWERMLDDNMGVVQ